ncbi:ATP-binding protein [Streptomyces lavendulae]|uniref:ATP-binding protein n=1 Tax=Streptomyces lavendulae TaxID=1914 RepID=UPI00367560EA
MQLWPTGCGPPRRPRRTTWSEPTTDADERGQTLPAAERAPVLPEAARRCRSTEPGAGPGPHRADVDCDFAAQPGVDEQLIRGLATLRFLDDASNVLFVGPPGVGKTMLSVALGRAAVEAGHRVYFTTAAVTALGPRARTGTNWCAPTARPGAHHGPRSRTADGHRRDELKRAAGVGGNVPDHPCVDPAGFLRAT